MKTVYKSSESNRAGALRLRRKQKELGLCVQGACPAPPVESKTLCQVHLDDMKARSREYRVSRAAAGLCVDCGGPLQDNAWRCTKCGQRAHSRQPRKNCLCGLPHRYREHVKLGFCGAGKRRNCQNKAEHLHLCPAHEQERAARTTAYKRSYRTPYLEGKCTRCRKEPIAEGSRSRCTNCLAYAAQAEARKYQARREARHLLSRLCEPHKRGSKTILVEQPVYDELAYWGLTKKNYRWYNSTVEIAPLEIVE